MKPVSIHKAKPSDLPTIKNLFPFYLYDMSEFIGWSTTPDGRHQPPYPIDPYWSDPDKVAFILRAGQEPAGFVLLLKGNHGPTIDYSFTDFFIMRKFRRRGVGQRIARQLFHRYPGHWQVDLLTHNKPAANFWKKVIHTHTRGKFKTQKTHFGDGPVTIFHFTTR